MTQTRTELLTPEENVDKNIIPFVSVFNTQNEGVFEIIKNNLDILWIDSTMENILNSVKIIKRKHQPQNLKQILLQSHFLEEHPTAKRCNQQI